MKYLHAFDLVSCVENEHEDFYNTPKEELINAMRARLSGLTDEEVFDAFGHIETNCIENKEAN